MSNHDTARHRLLRERCMRPRAQGGSKAFMRRGRAVTALLAGVVVAAANVSAQGVNEAPGALLRGLDKMAGSSVDMDLDIGQSGALGPLTVTLAECRYLVDDPAAEAYAWITVRDQARATVLFDGWMVASSPALNALDHARFDVWVLRCKTS